MADYKGPLHAAIDLGANSFHLALIAPGPRRLETREVRKSLVRMVAGIVEQDGHCVLDPRTKRKVMQTLARFRDFLADQQLASLSVVGTSAFRQLSDPESLIGEASKVLRAPIRLISGDEEARYIYLGACYGLEPSQRLLIDIGGGSTEFALGAGPLPEQVFSLDIGCISLTQQFFLSTHYRPEQIEAARQYCRQVLTPKLSVLRDRLPPNCRVLGASGSIKSIYWALRNLNIAEQSIEASALNRLTPLLYQAESLHHLAQVIDLTVARSRVFAAGVIVLQEIFALLAIEQMAISPAALREGLVAEYLLATGEQGSDSVISGHGEQG